MAGGRKKKKCPPEGAADWLLTYGDMVTLLLTFFVLLYTTAEVDGYRLQLVLAAFPGLGNLEGGVTLSEGRLAELGNTIESLPSVQRGRALDEARRQAVSIFEPEVRSNEVRITQDERGLVVSLASDAFFETASAELNIEASRDVFIKLSELLQSDAVADRKFRIEGHTDSIPTAPGGQWETNWELSTARSLSVLRLLRDYGVPEERFQVMGVADTVPLVSNDTAEGRAYNRRVDVIILTEGHL
ncbi:MAG: flagellar motor protein MotB [Spirochaetes bacterium]|jgi:chemotaxis protein MotB|nr:flagellar motor protein MotB [Spirochaetota bacterium]